MSTPAYLWGENENETTNETTKCNHPKDFSQLANENLIAIDRWQLLLLRLLLVLLLLLLLLLSATAPHRVDRFLLH